MRIATFAILSLALAGCRTDAPKPAQAQAAPSRPASAARTATAPEPTPEQERDDLEATDSYFRAVLQTIKEIDDGKTSPDVIARTAVSQNLPLLRAKASAHYAPFAQSSPIRAEVVKREVAALPKQRDYDDATYLVLKSRRPAQGKPSSTPGKPRTVFY